MKNTKNSCFNYTLSVVRLHIVARAFDKSAHSKLRKAGAENTISPNELGGARLAALLLKPAVVSFMDVITRAGDVDLELDEVNICEGSPIINKQIQDTKIREDTGSLILAIKKANTQAMQFNPGFQEILEKGDKLLVLGQTDQINELRKLACDNLE